MSDPTKYGDRLFGIKLPDNELIYVYADFLYFESGCLLALRESSEKLKHVNLALPPKAWESAFAASIIDGQPVAIDYPEPESEE